MYMVFKCHCHWHDTAEGFCRRFRIKLRGCTNGQLTICYRIQRFLSTRIEEIYYSIWIWILTSVRYLRRWNRSSWPSSYKDYKVEKYVITIACRTGHSKNQYSSMEEVGPGPLPTIWAYKFAFTYPVVIDYSVFVWGKTPRTLTITGYCGTWFLLNLVKPVILWEQDMGNGRNALLLYSKYHSSRYFLYFFWILSSAFSIWMTPNLEKPNFNKRIP